MSATLTATTTADLDALLSELPVAGRTRRRPTRFLLALFGSSERAGRLRLSRSALCISLFGNVDFDLRQATLEGDVITIFAVAAFAALDVYVPEGVEVDLHGLTVFGHKDAQGSDVEPLPGTPLVRVYAFGIFAGMDVWRVPLSWAKRTLGQVIKGIELGEHRELEP
jgi:Cell wall-active antibiotics response 4TMS YvqF